MRSEYRRRAVILLSRHGLFYDAAMTEQDGAAPQHHEAGEGDDQEGLVAASEHLSEIVDRYSQLSADKVLAPDERRRLNEVAEVLHFTIEHATGTGSTTEPPPPDNGLPTLPDGVATPLPLQTD